MATSAKASAVIPVPIEKVWAALRDFTFPARLFTTIDSATLEEGATPTSVGGVRVLRWKTGEIQKQRLLELSDLERRAVWETIHSEPEHEVSAVLTTLQAHRITENNATLVSWSAEYSADVKGDFIQFQQKAFAKNLEDIKHSLG